jgi:hypothetical protein
MMHMADLLILSGLAGVPEGGSEVMSGKLRSKNEEGNQHPHHASFD